MRWIIINIYRFAQQAWLKQLSKLAKKSFEHYSIIGFDFTCSHIAKCINTTGDRSSIVIGDHCDINGTLLADKAGKISIGDYTTVRFRSVIHSVNKIDIGNHVIISNNVTIMDNNNHPVEPEKRIAMSESGFYSDLWKCIYSENKPIRIGDNVWIGEKAVILKGVTIGQGSIVALAAVVTKDVPAYCVVAGNPAKVVKYLK